MLVTFMMSQLQLSLPGLAFATGRHSASCKKKEMVNYLLYSGKMECLVSSRRADPKENM
jgi:hypothetical protein